MLAEMTAEWDVRKLKQVARIRSSNVDKKSDPDETPVRLCNYTDVYYNESITGDLPLMEATASSEEIQRFSLRRGDVLLTKDSETWDDIGVPAYVAEPIDKGVCGYHLAHLRPRATVVDGAFLARALSARGVREQFHLGANGITRYGLTLNDMGEVLVPVPPLTTQRAIAAFLDRETAKIDTLIEKKRRLLDLLDEKRTALITHAVTRGLAPDVPMKNSGVEWLGEIPGHWEVQTCGARFTQVDERGFPDLPLLEVSIRDGVSERTFSDDRIEQQAADWNTYKRAREKDIAFNKMRMWQGAIGVVPCDGLVSPDYTVARPRDGTYSPYYELLFRTSNYLTEVNRHSHGIVDDRNRLYWQGFKSIRIPVPPLREQETIVEDIQNRILAIDDLRGRIHHAISLLQEYRTALISAAVTGQIEIPATPA